VDCTLNFSGLQARPDLSRSLVDAINRQRTAAGVKPVLKTSPILTKIAFYQAIAFASGTTLPVYDWHFVYEGCGSNGDHNVGPTNECDWNPSTADPDVVYVASETIKCMDGNALLDPSITIIGVGIVTVPGIQTITTRVIEIGNYTDVSNDPSGAFDSGDPYAGIPQGKASGGGDSGGGAESTPSGQTGTFILRPDSAMVKAGQTVYVDVLRNDGNANSDGTLVRKISKPRVGRASIFQKSEIEYTAPKGFHGIVTLRYFASRDDGKSGWETVTIHVR
jgi:hypothetical protein